MTPTEERIPMDKIIFIAGPTAVGKTRCALELAEHLHTEIISADSMQIYKFLDIGTAKPTPTELARIRHHMIDVADPLKNDFSVAAYREQAQAVIRKLLNDGKTPIVAGGTGLYINALLFEMDFSKTMDDPDYRESLMALAAKKGSAHLHGLLKSMDPESAEIIHPNNLVKIIRAMEVYHKTGRPIHKFSRDIRPDYTHEALIFCLHRERGILYDRINTRVDQMMEEGLVDEVARLKGMGLGKDHIAMKGIGYKEVLEHLAGKTSEEEMLAKIKRNSRHYAKRQLTWFRRYADARWIELTDCHEENMKCLLAETNQFLSAT